jgi:hypothetical protein
MTWVPLLLGLLAPIQAPALEEPHAANAVYRALLDEGISIDDRTIRLPAPRLHDGLGAEQQHAELRKITGSDQGAAEFLRDSISAPIVLKLRDDRSAGYVVRQGDLWFALRADFDAIDPDQLRLKTRDQKPVEAGNMRFESRILEAADLKPLGIEAPKQEGFPREWYLHLTGRLLDRIHVEQTERGVATRSQDSWVVAARADPRFDREPKLANRWWPILKRGAREEPGPTHPYPGGGSYVKISRLTEHPGVLLAEAHFAFSEPQAWFDGAPILRSKIGVIAQDQVRQLRRELAKRKTQSKSGK